MSRGTRVLVSGPDGVGKSTVVAAACTDLSHRGLRIRRVHFNPDEVDTGVSNTDPHAEPSHSVALGIAAVSLRAWRYTRSYAMGSLSGRGTDVVLQERGWQDQIVDPKRYRLAPRLLPLVRSIGRITPQPELAVIVTAPAHVVRQRKQELSEADIARQLERSAAVTSGVSKLRVDTSQLEVEDAARSISDAVQTARAKHISGGMRRAAFAPRRLRMVSFGHCATGIRTLYRPASAAGGVARAVAEALHWVGPPERGTHWLAELLCHEGIPFDSFAAIRSEDRERYVVATVINGSAALVIKIAGGFDTSLSREAVNLDMAADVPDLEVPRMVATGEFGGRAFLAMTPIGPPRGPRSADLHTALRVAVQLSYARGGRGLTHGDFAPWNLSRGNPAALVDWEDASANFIPGFDLAHFVMVVSLANARPVGNPDPAKWKILQDYAELTGARMNEVLAGAHEGMAKAASRGFRGERPRPDPPSEHHRHRG